MNPGAGARARFETIKEINNRTIRKIDPPRNEDGKRLPVSAFFGMNTFGIPAMKEKLPRDAFQRLSQAIDLGQSLDHEVADIVANTAKEWALLRGCTHFCHWFQPQTGSTAEKHDAFLTFDKAGNPIEKLSGSQLIQSEPDASSFPSGGMRTTFEARGYTAWDPSSPMFIMETVNSKTLCIPSVFISYHGDALDEKTGLLRSMEALSSVAKELLTVAGLEGVNRVVPTLGIEQEYFLIDRAFHSLRPDLVMTGRTLIGGQPPKGQQLEDHYFGAIPARVQAFMSEVEQELFKLGVPAKTRHNEVAPNQFEIAPIFEEANVATDHNQLTMEILRKVAQRHQFSVLLHEKPFSGVNGSGKHNNWSLMVAASGSELNGMNLLEPGKTPHQNLRFLLILTSILKGVHKHAGLLRAAIASSGNDHRLGANEAPPAVISVFLGEMLNRILNEIEKGTLGSQGAEQAVIRLGVSQIPEVAKDNTDRNRTSPLAFTGNKFEFRAVGSSASTAFPVTVLNAAVTEGMSEVLETLKAALASGKKIEDAIMDAVRKAVKESEPIRFEGNGYSDAWLQEAARRGLPNLRKTPEALHQLSEKKALDLFSRFGIFSEAELNSRLHVRLERYVKNMKIEGETLRSMVETHVLPAAYAYSGDLAHAVRSSQEIGIEAPQKSTLTALNALIVELQKRRSALEAAEDEAEKASTEEGKAAVYADRVAGIMEQVRLTVDALEAVVGDDYWPLPKYREILFSS